VGPTLHLSPHFRFFHSQLPTMDGSGGELRPSRGDALDLHGLVAPPSTGIAGRQRRRRMGAITGRPRSGSTGSRPLRRGDGDVAGSLGEHCWALGACLQDATGGEEDPAEGGHAPPWQSRCGAGPREQRERSRVKSWRSTTWWGPGPRRLPRFGSAKASRRSLSRPGLFKSA
jgi:hypothetical protein